MTRSTAATCMRGLALGLAMFVMLVCSMSMSQAGEPAARRKVIIDQDAFGPATSNLQAILMLLQASDVEVLGITVTSGDGWRDEEVSHTLRLLEIAKRADVGVYPGAVYPLVNSQQRTKIWESQYGKLFYKGAWTEQWPSEGTTRRSPYHADPFEVPPSPAGAPTIHAATENAASFLVRKVHEFPGQVTILSAGPLTNIALAARLDPQFTTLAKEFVFMGGSFNPTSAGNEFAVEYANTPRLEFNMRWDPEAASLVLHEPWKQITQIPIDPTTRTFFKPEYFQQLARGHAPFDAYLAAFGQPYPMWDELAVAVWLDPTIVRHSIALLVDVDTSFTAGYGNTLSWAVGAGPGLGERPVTVVQDVDVPKFERLTLDLLSREPPKR
jgi:inosine-uridine nucleoside N-ribohydrolase